MKAKIYIEGGGDSKELHSRCREGFSRLLDSSGFKGRMPQLIACGARDSAYRDFKTASIYDKADYVAMLVDSEEPVSNPEDTWDHLMKRDGWEKPDGCDDSQVFLMTTCMESWIAADYDSLKEHYGSCLRESVLPSLHDIEE